MPVYSLSYLTTFPHHRRHLQPPHRRVKHNPKPSLLLEKLWALFPSVILFHPWSPSPTLQYLPRPDNQSLPRSLAPPSRRGPTFTAFPPSIIRCHLLSASDPGHAAVPSITNFHLLSGSDTSHAVVPSIINFHHLWTKASSFLFSSIIIAITTISCQSWSIPNLPIVFGLAVHTSVLVFLTTTRGPPRASPPCSSPATQTQLSHPVLQLLISLLLILPSSFPSKRLRVFATVRTAITDTATRLSRPCR